MTAMATIQRTIFGHKSADKNIEVTKTQEANGKKNLFDVVKQLFGLKDIKLLDITGHTKLSEVDCLYVIKSNSSASNQITLPECHTSLKMITIYNGTSANAVLYGNNGTYIRGAATLTVSSKATVVLYSTGKNQGTDIPAWV